MEREFIIVNRLGLHARAAAKLVQATNRFEAEIVLRFGEQVVNGKSIMGVLMLAAAQGSRLQVEALGPDASEAMGAIALLFESGFGEDLG